MQGLLVIDDDRLRITGDTQLRGGSCLAEEVRSDASGRLVKAEATLVASDSSGGRDARGQR